MVNLKMKKLFLAVAMTLSLGSISNFAVAAKSLTFTPKLVAPKSEFADKTIRQREMSKDVTLAYYYYEDGKHKNLNKAKFWAEQGVQKEDKDSYFILGVMHFKGDAAKKDIQAAIDNLREASELDHKQASEMLGLIYYYGIDVPIDLENAFMYLSKVGETATPESKAILGKLYYSGDGVEKDEVMAFKFISEAAKANHPEAQAMLSVMYRKGQGTEANQEESLKWLVKATEKSMDARILLGMRYEGGETVPLDLKEAYIQYAWAKQGGSQIADKHLQRVKANMSKDQIDKAELMLRAKTSVKR